MGFECIFLGVLNLKDDVDLVYSAKFVDTVKIDKDKSIQPAQKKHLSRRVWGRFLDYAFAILKIIAGIYLRNWLLASDRLMVDFLI